VILLKEIFKPLNDIITEMGEKTLPNLLYIENDPIIVDVVRLFTKNKFNFAHASSGETGIQLAKTKKYSIILMDINLGNGLNGFQTAKIIKSLPEYKETPIIATTAYSLPEFKENILNNEGCTHILIKPFNKMQLLDFLNEVISQDKITSE